MSILNDDPNPRPSKERRKVKSQQRRRRRRSPPAATPKFALWRPSAPVPSRRRRRSRKKRDSRFELLVVNDSDDKTKDGRAKNALEQLKKVNPTPQCNPASGHCRNFRIALCDLILGHASDNWTEFEFGIGRVEELSWRSEKSTPIQGSTDEERLLLFRSYQTDNRRQAHGSFAGEAYFRRDIRHVPVKRLLQLYNIFCSRDSFKFGKEAVINELVEYYYRGRLPTARRAEEREVLASLDTENLFFVLRAKNGAGETKELTLPKDLMRTILSFLRYDRTIVPTIGLVSWEWYVLVLSTWNCLRVRKKNIQTIPVAILKSVSSLEFHERSYNRAKSRLTKSEVTFVMNTVVPQRLRKITFVGQTVVSLPRLISPLAAFNKGTRRNPGPRLASLRVLRISQHCFEDSSEPKSRQMEKLAAVRLATVAPNLTTVTGCRLFSWVEGLARLRCLRVLRNETNQIPRRRHNLGRAELGSLSELRLPRLDHFAIRFAGMREVSDFPAAVAGWVRGMLRIGQLRALEMNSLPPAYFSEVIRDV